jgi:acetyl esterase/lipase
MAEFVDTYRGMGRAALDAAYNNSLAVADSPRIVADWQARSARLRGDHPQTLDLPYGPAVANRIDYFSAPLAGRSAPLLVFIHGGYWQMRAKEDFSFLAAGPLAHGINVALVAYTLAPHIRVDGIVAEVRASIAWLAGHSGELGHDAGNICLSGWSAGGHLTAMLAQDPAVKGSLAISGIFDLEPVKLCYLNEKLGLDDAEARRNSPLLHLPTRSAPLVVTYGTAELPELQRQSVEYAAEWAAAGLPGHLAPQAGLNHFTILEQLADPAGALASLVIELTRS